MASNLGRDFAKASEIVSRGILRDLQQQAREKAEKRKLREKIALERLKHLSEFTPESQQKAISDAQSLGLIGEDFAPLDLKQQTPPSLADMFKSNLVEGKLSPEEASLANSILGLGFDIPQETQGISSAAAPKPTVKSVTGGYVVVDKDGNVKFFRTAEKSTGGSGGSGTPGGSKELIKAFQEQLKKVNDTISKSLTGRVPFPEGATDELIKQRILLTNAISKLEKGEELNPQEIEAINVTSDKTLIPITPQPGRFDPIFKIPDLPDLLKRPEEDIPPKSGINKPPKTPTQATASVEVPGFNVNTFDPLAIGQFAQSAADKTLTPLAQAAANVAVPGAGIPLEKVDEFYNEQVKLGLDAKLDKATLARELNKRLKEKFGIDLKQYKELKKQ